MTAFLKNIVRVIHTLWGVVVFLIFVFSAYFYALYKYWQKGRQAFFEVFALYKFWSNVWLKLTGMKLKVEGVEYFKSNPVFIAVGNHSSTLDMFSMASSMPMPFKTLAKKEIERIPIIGLIFKIGCIHVDRKSLESRKESVGEIKRELAEGYSILILPEGTRNKSAKPLGEFKDGAFRIAIETQTPIMPFVILNVRTLMPHPQNIIQNAGTIKVKFLKPVEVAGLDEKDLPTIKAKVHSMIEHVLLAEDPYFNKSLD